MFSLIAMVLLSADNQMYKLIESSKTAALGSMQKDTPFISLVPYAIDKTGNPIIFISDMAVHTKNLQKTASCSLMMSKENKEDVFNSQRVTFLGKMEKVPEKEIEEVKKAYLEKYPDQEYLMELDDFAFYRMKITKIYYVGGFGDINWIAIDEYLKHWNKELKND